MMHATNHSFANQGFEGMTILPALAEPTLVDEANHRIANSLQLLSAMISIEARMLEDRDGVAVLELTRGRIDAIAAVHRLLCEAGDGGTVDLATYLGRLGAELELGSGHHILVEAEPVVVAARDATVIGMILSELVTNACKHAYAAGETGEIRVALSARGRGYLLEISDDGRGLPLGGRADGLGSRLIGVMARRLGGRWEYQDAGSGTRFALHVGVG